MTQARLVVEMPEGPWVADVSRQFPEVTFKVLAALPGDGSGFAIVWITASDVDPVLEAMDDHGELTDVSIVQRTDREATVHFETSAPMLLMAAKRAGVPIEMPIEISSGEATIDVTGSKDRLSELGRQFDDLGFEFRIEHIRERFRPSQLLTDTQRELVVTATELGYYDTPRECTLSEVADHLGIAKSTCSETLHRAEGTIVKQFVGSLPARTELDEEPPA